MNKQRKTSHILNVFQYDADGHVVLPASLTLSIAPGAEDNNSKVPTTAWVRGLVSTTGSSLVPTSRSISINGTSYDLSSNRSWTIDTGVLTASAGSGISVSVVNQNLNIVNTGLLTGTAGTGISVSTVNQNLNIVNTGLLTGTAGAGISVTTVNQNLNIVNTGLLTASSGLGISVTTVGQNLNIVNTGILTASSGSGISLSVVGQNLNIVNIGILTATAGAGISLSVVSGNLNIVNTITNNNQLDNGAGYATTSYVTTQINNLVSGAPGLLDTLDELAAALGDDPNFATTVSTALGNRLRVDINTQALTSTQQGNGRTNLGLGTAATSNTGDFVAYRTFGTAANSAVGDFVAYRTFGTAANNNTGDFAAASHTHSIANVTGLQTALDGKQASGSYAAATHSHIISDVTGLQTALDGKQASLGFTPYNSTNPNGYITGYTETDTLASVTARGATTSTETIFTGTLKTRKSQTAGDYTTAALWTESFSNTATGIAFHISGVKGTYLEMRTNQVLYWDGNTVYHSGNIPTWNQNTTGTAASISGFNNPTTTASANTIVYRDANGYIDAVYFKSTNTNVTTTAPISITGKSSGDSYMYEYSQAAVRSFLGLGSLAYSSATIPTNNNQLTNGAGYITSAGNAATATYATNSTRLYASDGVYVYGGASPYYMYMTYDGTRWLLQVTPGTPAAVRVAYADSAGSAGNATTVGGLAVHTDRNNEANKIVRTDANGYIQAGWINTLSGDNGTSAITRIYASDDAYLRYYTPANFRQVLDVPTRTGGSASGSWGINITGTAGSAPNGSNINNYYDSTAGNGYGFRFWNGSDAYKISMGASALYYYGPVTDYSIKTQMNDGDTGRGFTWGRTSYAPIAALNSTSGNMQIAGTFTSTALYITGSTNGGYIYSNDWGIKLANSNGYIQFGPANGSWSHIYSDKSFYFNQELYVNSQILIHSGSIGSQSVSYATTAGSATTATTASNLAANTSPTIQILNFTGVGTNSGNANQSYAIYQEGGSWAPPFPDLCIGYHTGIKIGAYYGYNGIRFYNNSDFVTQTFSVNDGDNHVRVAYNLYVASDIVYNNMKFTGDQTYGFLGRNVYADTINGRGSDPLELNYYDGGSVIIGTGANGSKALYAGSLFSAGSAVITTANIGSQTVSNAGSAGSLPTLYAGGQQTNPQVYFNNGIGLRVAMTGAWSVWSDTLWINGYSGGDVKQMCALHTLRNGTPRMSISVQAHDATAYGTFYEFITEYNIASQTVSKLNPLSGDSNYKLAYTADGARTNAGEWGRAVMFYVPNGQTYGIRVDRADLASDTSSVGSALGNTHTWTGAQNNFLGNGNTASTNNVGLVVYSTGGNGAQMSFHRSGAYAVNMGLDSDNVFRIGGWSAAANRLQLDMSGNLTVVNVNATNYYMSGNTAKYITNFAGSHTAIYIGGSQSAYSGFTVDGGMRVMVHTSGVGAPCGFYHENQGWSALFYVNGTSALFYSAAEKITTQSYGVYVTGEIRASSDITAYYSDIRLKKDIDVIPNAIKKIKKLRGVTYTWNEEEVNVVKNRSGQRDIGLIAQEVEAIEPLFTKEYQTPLEETPKDANAAANFTPRMSETYKTIKYDKLVALLVEGMKEQQLQIEELKNKLDNVLSSR